MKTIRILIICIILTSCYLNNKIDNNKLSNHTTENISEKKFKKWLNDTLLVLDKSSYYGYKRDIKIYEDSLYFEISKAYDTIIEPNIIIKDKELSHALNLLERENKLPKEKFEIRIFIILSYNSPMVEQLTYEDDYEFKTFDVIFGDSICSYNFLKGNLIDETCSKK